MYVYAHECVYMSMCVGAPAYVCMSEDKLQELVLFLHHVSPRDGAQVARLGGKHPPPSLSQKLSLLNTWHACAIGDKRV